MSRCRFGSSDGGRVSSDHTNIQNISAALFKYLILLTISLGIFKNNLELNTRTHFVKLAIENMHVRISIDLYFTEIYLKSAFFFVTL